ncbi:Uncharacterised protein [uncultured archaeon]|nr:Uncharacterised protein [uncultured archaeon]
MIEHDDREIIGQRNDDVPGKREGLIVLEGNAIFREIDKLHIANPPAFKEIDGGLIADLKYAIHLGKPVICTSHGIDQMNQYHWNIVDLVGEGLPYIHDCTVDGFSILKQNELCCAILL